MSFLPSAGGRLVVIAFEGWNDAGEAAVDTARHLVGAWDLSTETLFSGDEYYDMTFIRPAVRRDADGPAIEWPGCVAHTGVVPGTELPVEVVIGTEPSYRWREYIDRLRERFAPDDRVVLLGSLLADVTHTRPLPVATTAEDPALARELGIDEADYTGPVGILGVLSTTLAGDGMAAVSHWVAVPAYAASSPSPKAVLAMLGAFEDLTGLVVDQRELVDEARAWEVGTDALVESDEDLAEHVARIEGMTDATELPQASGEAIAREFERYLSRRRREE